MCDLLGMILYSAIILWKGIDPPCITSRGLQSLSETRSGPLADAENGGQCFLSKSYNEDGAEGAAATAATASCRGDKLN